MSDARWWRNIPVFAETQRREDFQAWAEALDLGIELCVDTPEDWFPGFPDGDYFSDEAISFVEGTLLDTYEGVEPLQEDSHSMLLYLKYLGQAYVDKLEGTWVGIPSLPGRWPVQGWGVELPWRYDWFLDMTAAVEVAAVRRSGDQWLSSFARHRDDYERWKAEDVVFDRFSAPASGREVQRAARRPLLSRFVRPREAAPDAPAIDTESGRLRFVRDLAVKELERRGVTVHPAPQDAPGDDRFVGDDGSGYRLRNLQRSCSLLPQSEWPGAVDFHFRQLLAGQAAPAVSELTESEFLAQLRTRLQPRDTARMAAMKYARPAFDGLVAELSRDLPTSVQTVGNDDVAEYDLERLYAVGQQNTDAEAANVRRMDHDVFVLSGESFFIASKALNMPHLIDTVLGGAAPMGVIFSVPHRNVLFLHAVGATTVAAVSWIAVATVDQAQNPPGGVVSHETYFWRDGTIQRITRTDPTTDALQILAEGAFGEAMSQVGGWDGDSAADAGSLPTDIGPPSEHDVVRLKHSLRTKDFDGTGEVELAAGTKGTIVFVGENPPGYLVEFGDGTGGALAIPELCREDFEIIWRCPDGRGEHQ